MKNIFFGNDLITVTSLKKEDVFWLFTKTKEMEKLVAATGGDDRLRGKIMAALFFEPSTRTFSSFISAMQRLGGGMIPLNGMQNTSVEKGESYQHTVIVFSRYADCLVIRHPKPGMPATAASIVDKPVVNAGDGTNEHPTQALFDTYTIYQHFKTLNGLRISFVGDLKNGRTVHSLSQVLALLGINIHFNFVSPKVLKIPSELMRTIKDNGVSVAETEDLSDVVATSDVIYMTRVQKERFTDLSEYERLKSFYILNRRMLRQAKKNLLVMHPLPIAAGEIDNDLDTDTRSVYLTSQVTNGLYLRMALLDLILRKQ